MRYPVALTLERFASLTALVRHWLIVAGVVWMEYAARETISRLVVTYLAFLCIPLGDPYHVKSPARRTTA